jgi:hypothetical protein
MCRRLALPGRFGVPSLATAAGVTWRPCRLEPERLKEAADWIEALRMTLIARHAEPRAQV